MCKITINIESVFNGINRMDELKATAQDAVNQIQDAYNKRFAELAEVVAVDEEKATTSSKTKPQKGAEEKPTKEVEQVPIKRLTKAQIKAMKLKFEKYTEKCMFLTGNTRSIKDEIKAMSGATWNGRKQGWFLKNETAQELAKALKIKIA